MEDIKTLLEQQKKAREDCNTKKLCEINIKIFSIREQQRKKRSARREAEREARAVAKIWEICERFTNDKSI